MNTVNVVGVQFRRAGKIYHFTPGDWDLRIGDAVVVDTDRGPSLAEVATISLLDDGGKQDENLKDLKPIVRKASQKDIDSIDKLKPEYVESFARDALARHDLKIRILKAEVQLGGNKVVVYFSAPGRVDFRELVKDLATGLMARVELKQVGARDEAKLVGGLGICGREFCCSSFLREFVPVSIKMAKNQNLALNPTKVSGGCGRLLCCLTYENDTYTELRRLMPGKGAKVRVIDDGSIASVIKSDLINQLVMVVSDDGVTQTLPVSHVEVLTKDGNRSPKSRTANVGPVDEGHVGTAATEASDSDESLAEAEIWAEEIDLGDLGVATDTGGKPVPQQSGPSGQRQQQPQQSGSRSDNSPGRDAGRRGKRGRRRGRGGGHKNGSGGGSPTN